MQTFSNLINLLSRLLQYALIILMAFLVAVVTWQVLSRFVLGSPSSFTEELSRYVLIWIGLLGSALAYKEGMHLGIDLLLDKLSGSNKKCLCIFIHSVAACFALFILVIGGGRLMLLTFELKQLSASLGIPMGYVYSVLPVSGVLMFLYSVQFVLFELRLAQVDEGLSHAER